MQNPEGRWIATVGYVRSLRIGSLTLHCEGKRHGGYGCDHRAVLDLAGYPDALPLDDIEQRLVCTACGAIGKADVRPNWSEVAARSLFGH